MAKTVTTPFLIKRSSKIHGLGVFARKYIPWGTKIVRYSGVVSSKPRDSDALFELDAHKTIDGRVRGNIAQFINHSRRRANCFVLREKSTIWIVAGIEGIKRGQELTFDYGREYYP